MTFQSPALSSRAANCQTTTRLPASRSVPAVSSLGQHRARRVCTLVVLHDAIDWALQRVAELLDKPRGLAPAHRLRANRCW